jgi:hypothetical protein
MASYHADYNDCYCEENPEDDFTCDGYTAEAGYTTYKMSKKEEE